MEENNTGVFTSMEKKTIWIITSFFYPHPGGVERYVHYFAKGLTQLNYKVVVICLDTEHIGPRGSTPDYEVFRLPCFSILNNRFPIPIFGNKFWKIFCSIPRSNLELIVINVRFYILTLFGVLFARKEKIHSVIIDHGAGKLELGNRVGNFLSAQYIKLITFFEKKCNPDFLGVSEASTRWLKTFGIEPRGVVYNGIDITLSPQDFIDYRARYRISESCGVIAFVGRLIPEKGIMEFLEAVQILLAEGEDFHCFVAGDGPLESDVKQKTDHERIHYLGRINEDQVTSLLSKTDILVHPSRATEGLPSVLLEAALQHCAVIATPVGGTVEIVPDEDSGFLIADNSVNNICEAIRAALHDSEGRKLRSDNLYKYVIKKFDWNLIIQGFVDLMFKQHAEKEYPAKSGC